MLILDDDVLDLEGIKLMIDTKQAGIDGVFCAETVSAAKDIVRRERVDIALCDIEMPGESGLDFVGWMASCGMDTLVIFVTSHAKFDYASQALKLQARDYLLKPVSPEALQESLNKAAAFCRKNREVSGNTKQPISGRETEENVIARVKQYVALHLTESISRADIAAEIYLHPDYLARRFKNECGIPLSAYIRGVRIEKAKTLLRSTSIPVHEIARQCGFSQASYFSGTFEKETGVLPLAFRKMKTPADLRSVASVSEKT